MTFKFIINQLEIDLIPYRLEIVEENQWFSDSFFVRYTMPFEMDLTPELDRALGMISNINSASYQTIFEGDLFIGNLHQSARLEIKEVNQTKLSVQIYYGFNDFPNFNKKLSQLKLVKIDIDKDTPYASIYALAKAYILQSVEEVDFNFPCIIPTDDKYNTDDDKWEHFEGLINKYEDGDFVENEFIPNQSQSGGVQYNRNIMHPMIYALSLLKQGFADAGFQLRGDVLTNDELKELMVIVENDYYTSVMEDNIEMLVPTSDYVLGSINDGLDQGRPSSVYTLVYNDTLTITEPGYYVFSGNFEPYKFILRLEVRLKVNDTIIYSTDSFVRNYEPFFSSFDVPVELLPGNGPYEVNFDCKLRAVALPNNRGDESLLPENILDMSIVRVSKYDSNGDLVPTLVDATSIDLRKSVPDMTFGNYVKAITALYNYELIPKENKVIEMNRITPKLSAPATVDLRSKESKYPQRSFTPSKSYILKLRDTEDSDSNEIYVDANGYKTSNYSKSDDTEEISIELLPLPQERFQNLETAKNISDDNTILKLARFAPSSGNLTKETGLNITNIYARDYKDWLNFRINSNKIAWSFKTIIEHGLGQSVYDKCYGYNMELISRKLTKTILSKDYVEIEIEAEA